MKKTVCLVIFAAITSAVVRPAYAQWVQTNGPFAVRVYSLAVSDTNLFAGVDGGVYLSTNNGTSWTSVYAGYVDALLRSGGNLFAGTYEGVFLSTNNGTSWSTVNTGLTNTIVLSLAVSGTNLFAGVGAGGVFLSTNNGTGWTGINRGLTNSVVWSLAVSPNGTGGTNLFAGTEGGVFLSTDSAKSWTTVNAGLKNKTVYALAVKGDNLFAGTWGGGVFRSTNNGTSWTAVNTGLTNWDVAAFAVIGTNLFAGTYGGGVVVSTNNGTSWTDVSTGLTALYVYSLAVTDTVLLAGTEGGGVWRRPLSEIVTSVNVAPGEMPAAFMLNQNYPNPFNPSTKIEYQLPVAGHVTLRVYDVLGREVATLVNEIQNAGAHVATFDGTRLVSGLYLCRLTASGKTQVRKMLLVK